MNISFFFLQFFNFLHKIHVPLKYRQDIIELQDENPKKLTGCDVGSDHSMNVPVPISRPSPTRMVPLPQLTQNGLNSVQYNGLWDAVAMEIHCLQSLITDCVLPQPPMTISYEENESFRCSERMK